MNATSMTPRRSGLLCSREFPDCSGIELSYRLWGVMAHAETRFRSYRAEDLDAMHALDVVCFERPFRFTRGAMRRFAEAKKATLVIAEEEDALIGFVILHTEEAEDKKARYVITVDVDPAFRRRGVARLLMREAERQACNDGCFAMVLHVYTGNVAAVQFYAQIGYVRSHRVEGFYGAGIDAWECHKLLDCVKA